MIVKLNKYGYIESYNTIPTEEILDGWMQVENAEGNPCDYQYVNSKLVYNPIPNDAPEGFTMPEYNGSEWVETATEEDIFKSRVAFYNSELEFASKATAELACEIITQESYNEVKSYMKAIDPYAPKMFSMKSSVQRPNVFDRYK